MSPTPPEVRSTESTSLVLVGSVSAVFWSRLAVMILAPSRNKHSSSTDADDEDCLSAWDNFEDIGNADCDDSIDNDSDGWTDEADFDCDTYGFEVGYAAAECGEDDRRSPTCITDITYARRGDRFVSTTSAMTITI